MKRALLAAVAAVLVAGTAHAAAVTRSYTNVSTFASGPIDRLTLTYTVTFDPASTARVPTATLEAFSSSSALASFAGPNGAEVFREGGRTFLTLGGLASFGVGSTNAFTDDFFTFFQFDVVGTDADAVSYGRHGSGDLLRSATSVTTAATAAVPEPAGWAAMVGGFGLLGGAVRRRRVRARFA